MIHDRARICPELLRQGGEDDYSYGFSSCLLDTFLNIIDALAARS